MMDYKNTIGTILSTMVQIKLVVCTKRNKVWLIWYQGDVESGLRSWLGRDCEEYRFKKLHPKVRNHGEGPY